MSSIASGFDPEQAWTIFHFAFKLGRSERAWRGEVAKLHSMRIPECPIYGGPCVQRGDCQKHGQN